MDDEDFPRGEATKKSDSSLKPKSDVKPKRKHDKDVLFKEREVKKVKKVKKRKNLEEDEEPEPKKKKESDDDEDGGIAAIGPMVKLIKTLFYEDVTEGMLLLGAIKEIHDYELVISLPHGLIGYVHITDVSEVYTKQLQKVSEGDGSEMPEQIKEVAGLADIFFEGQYVRCAVKEVTLGKKRLRRVKLTLDPRVINDTYGPAYMKFGLVLPGVVSSVEDHGYTVDLGIKGVRGFLNFKFAKVYTDTRNAGKPLLVGQLVECCVKEVTAEGHSVTLTINPAKIQKAVAKVGSYPYLHLVIPGTKVAATVAEVKSDYVLVNFLAKRGTVNHLHLQDGGQKPKKGDELEACVLFANTATSSVGLTLQSSICDRVPKARPPKKLHIGKIFKNAVIKQIVGNQGLMLQMADSLMAYVQKSNVSDEKLRDPLKDKFTVGSKVKCRITGYNCLDGVSMATMKSSVIEQIFLDQSDIKNGMKIKAEVSEFNKFGMEVRVTNSIVGFIPLLHIADIPLKHPEMKFKRGDPLLCRVLCSDPKKKRLILTHKRTLVESDLPVLGSYDKAEPDMCVHGMVVSVGNYGCIVKFYNDVKGLVPRSKLGAQCVESPESIFYKGQVVKCQILSCNPGEEKMTLCLEGSPSTSHVAEVHSDFEVGKLTQAKVVARTNEGLKVEVSPSDTPALLPKMHLSDSTSNAETLFNCYQPGDVITEVMYLTKQTELIVTKKPSLIQAAKDGKIVASFNDLETGCVLAGFVKRIAAYGVFVEFPNNLNALCPKMYMADIYVPDASLPYKEGQSVSAYVLEIDNEKRRFLVSLKPSQCHPHYDRGGVSLLGQYLRERDSVVEKVQQVPTKSKVTGMRLGSVLMATVAEVQENGLLLQLENGTTGIASIKHTEGVDCPQGSDVKVCVLHVNYDSNIVEVTLKTQIVKTAEKMVQKKKLPKVPKHQKCEACVELVKDDIVIVSHSNGQLAMLPGKKHLNDGVRMKSDVLHVGQKIEVVIKKSTQNSTIGIQDDSKLKLDNTRSRQKNKGATLNSEERQNEHTKAVTNQTGIEIGTSVSAVVKSVRETCMHVVVSGSVPGRVHVTEILDKPTESQYPLKAFTPGQRIEGTVIGYQDVKHNKFLPVTHPDFQQTGLEITLKASKLKADPVSLDEAEYFMDIDKLLARYKVGETVWCYVEKYENEFLRVNVTPRIRGDIHRLNLSKIPQELQTPQKQFRTGQSYKAVIARVDTEHKKLELTRAGLPSHDLKVGAIMNGQIKKIHHDGLLVQLANKHLGKVYITDLFDQFTEKPLEKFRENQFIRCCVLDCSDKGHIALSARPSRLGKKTPQKTDPDIQSIGDVSANDLVKGYVRYSSDVGLFIKNLHGRVELKNLSSYYVRDHSKAFLVGQLVTAKILSIDKDRQQIELSLHPDHTGLQDQLAKEYRGSLRASHDSAKLKHAERRKKLQKRRRDEDGSDSGIDGVMKDAMDSDSEVEIITSHKLTKESKLPRLEISGFNWDDKPLTNEKTREKDASDESSDDDDDSDVKEKPPKKKTKKEKMQEKKEEEAMLYKTERALMDADRAPETTDDFDRLVVSSPDSSIVWIQYMAFHLHTTEIDKARVVAERALKTISFREEQEKLNVWVAYMNLENLYGTDETLAKVFERALQMCDPIKVFKALVSVYTKTEKLQQAEQLYTTMVRRFSLNKDVWTSYGMFLMLGGKQDAARKLMQRSFKSLEKQDHIDVIVKFAQFEFKFGEAERGRTMFENTLSNYPKRTDIWSIYIDMMIKQGNSETIRQLFERVIHLNLSPKKIKFFFKRYLDFEKKHGDEDTVGAVKQKALEYVESKTGVAEME